MRGTATWSGEIMVKIEDLVLSAAEKEDPKILAEIMKIFNSGEISADTINDCILTIVESWGDSIEKSSAKSAFVLSLSSLELYDSHSLRNAIEKALKKLLPPDISSVTASNILQLRDDRKSDMGEIFRNAVNLVNLRKGKFCCAVDGGFFGELEDIDTFIGTISVKDRLSGKKRGIGLKDAIRSMIVFNDDSAFKDDAGNLSAGFGKWMETLNSSSVIPVNIQTAREIAKHFICGRLVRGGDFQQWMEDCIKLSPKNNPTDMERSIASARNLEELANIIKESSETLAQKLDSPTIVALKNIFSKCAPGGTKGQVAYAKCAAIIANELDDEKIRYVFSTLENSEILPESPEKVKYELWESLSPAHIKGMLRIVSAIAGQPYLAESVRFMPLKSISLIPLEIVTAQIENMIRDKSALSSDLVLWIWKNRKKVSASMEKTVNFTTCIHSIMKSQNSGASRELKGIMIKDSAFQNKMLENLSGRIQELMDLMAVCDVFSNEEKSSLLVKLARDSDNLKDFLNSAKGREGRLMKSNREQIEAKRQDLIPVSLKSFKNKMTELERIINKDMPENTQAIAHARGYGDLRENAEYSAAKERQKFLMNRRESLENEIMSAKITHFNEAVPGTKPVIGSTVTIKMNDGREEKYHILGAWDSNPDKKIISCGSALAITLIGREKGTTVDLPNGTTAEIKEISPLPAEIIEELSNVPD